MSQHSSEADVPVLLADDHAATRAGVRIALEGSGFTIVAEAASADAAVEMALRHRPALCLIDLSMPGGGITATERISAALPEAKIVILTVSVSDDDLFQALVAGACGYMVKNASAGRLPMALRGVLAGEATLPRTLELRLIQEFRSRERRRLSSRRFRRGSALESELTPRESEVFELVAEHLPTTVIAQRLGISEVTVRRHISSAMQKLHVSDRASAVRVLSAEDDPPEEHS
jgi:two-component system nitrate/nitrite response regulator NarL